MLHPARRFWRGAGASPGAWPETDSCRLSVLERTLFGVRRIGDVPGHEIPGALLRLHAIRRRLAARAGPRAQPARPDFARRAHRPCRAPAGRRARSSSSARESLGAGRLLERGDRLEAAESCYRDAAERARYERGPDAAGTRADALRALAVRCRRDGRHEHAAEAWQAIAGDRRRAGRRSGARRSRRWRSTSSIARATWIRRAASRSSRWPTCGHSDDGATAVTGWRGWKETGASAGS